MNIITIPLRNIRRKPTRTSLLLLAFSLGVMSIVALYQVSQIVGHSLEQKLTSFGANIVVAPVTEKLSVSYGGFHMGDMLYDVQYLSEEKTVQAISSIELQDRISIVAPKLVTMLRIDEKAVAVVGVNWQEERGLKSYWAADGTFPMQSDQILFGNVAANKLGYGPGDVIELFGHDFKVSGVLYETGSDDDSVVFMDLSILQEMLDRPDSLSFVEVAALCSGCPIDDIVEQIQTGLPNVSVTALQNVVNQRMASVHFVQKLAFSVSIVILLTASAMVGLSMHSAVNERKKDIGILRTLGYGKSRVFLIFCLEAGIIGAFSGILGYFAGFGASYKISEILDLGGGVMPFFSGVDLAAVCLIFISVTVLSALYPAWKAASIDPTDALVAL